MSTAAVMTLWHLSRHQVSKTTRYPCPVIITVANSSVCLIGSFGSQQSAASATTEAAIDKHSSETATAHAVNDEVGSRVES